MGPRGLWNWKQDPLSTPEKWISVTLPLGPTVFPPPLPFLGYIPCLECTLSFLPGPGHCLPSHSQGLPCPYRPAIPLYCVRTEQDL